MRMTQVLITALLVPFFAVDGFADHTGIGSGGDVMEAYLKETRVKLIETLRAWAQTSPEEQALVCAGLGLSANQLEDCGQFIAVTAQNMLELHTGPTPVAFQVRAEPLFVLGPDGLPLRVAARTVTGPSGMIEFDYERIAARSPKLMLALLVHETGHKVMFPRNNDGAFIEDNAPILSFAAGRALLDAVGLALGDWALRHGIVGSAFSIRDKFYCEIAISDGASRFYQSGDSLRTFDSANASDPATKFAAFSTGIGAENHLQVGVHEGDSCLTLTLTMVERNGCKDLFNTTHRFIEMAIDRRFPSAQHESASDPVRLVTRHLPGENRACDEDRQHREVPMTIGYGNILFSCVYKGESADSRSGSTNSLFTGGCD